MKKVVVFGLALAMTASLVGCSGKKAKETEAKTEAKVQTEAATEKTT
jgi:hypothetical protein